MSKVLTPYCIQAVEWLEKNIILPFAQWFYLTKLYIIYDTIFNWFFIRQFTLLYKWYLIKDDDVRMDIYIAWVRRTFRRMRRAQDYEIEFVHHWVYLVPVLVLSLFYFLTTPLDFEIIFRNFIYLFYLKKLFMYVFLRHHNKKLWIIKYWNKRWVYYPQKHSMIWGAWGVPLTFIKYVNINIKYKYYFVYYFNDLYIRLNFFWIIWENYYELSRLFWYINVDDVIYPMYYKRWNSSNLYRKLNLIILPRIVSNLYLNLLQYKFFKSIDTTAFSNNFILYKYKHVSTYLWTSQVYIPSQFIVSNNLTYSFNFLFSLKKYFIRYYTYTYTLNIFDKLLFYFRWIHTSYYFFVFISKYFLCVLWIVNPFLVINPKWYKLILPFFKDLQFRYNNIHYLPTIFNYGYRVGINNLYFSLQHKQILKTTKFVNYNLNSVLNTIYFLKLNSFGYWFTAWFYSHINHICVLLNYNLTYTYLYFFRLIRCSNYLYRFSSNWFIKYWISRLL